VASLGANRSSGVRLDAVAAIAGLVLALALFPLRFLASQIYIETIPVVLGIACLLYLVTTYRPRDASVEPPVLSTGVARLLPGVCFVGMALLVALAVHAGDRTLPFYLLAGAVGSLVLLQPLLVADEDFQPRLALLQVVVLAFVIRLTALYTTVGFVGIDIWTHVPTFTAGIVEEQSLGAIAGDKYYASPLYHLLVAGASFLYDSTLRTALYLSVGVLMPVSTLFVYLTGRLLVRERWAVFAAALYAVTDYAIQWGIHLIPTSMGLAVYLAVLYALVRVMRTDYGAVDYGLLAFLTVIVVLTHQVSSFIMVVTLAAALGAQVLKRLGLLQPSGGYAFDARESISVAGLFVFDLGLITFMWSLTPYKGQSFLETMISYLRETLATSAGFLNLAGPSGGSSAGAAGGGRTLIEQVALYVDTLGFLLLLFATFLGCLYVVRSERARVSVLTLLVSSAVMLVFVLGLPMFGIRTLIPTRWFAFLYAPMALLAALGFRHLSRDLVRPLFVVCVLVFALVTPATMVLSSEATVDNPVFEDEREELSYSKPEIVAAYAVGDLTGHPRGMEIRPNQLVYTDHPYQTVIERVGSHPTRVAALNDSGPAPHHITVYRRAQSSETTFFRVNTTGQALNVPRRRICRPTQNVLYTNGPVVVCTGRE
jgi:hypothetical protein